MATLYYIDEKIVFNVTWSRAEMNNNFLKLKIAPDFLPVRIQA